MELHGFSEKLLKQTMINSRCGGKGGKRAGKGTNAKRRGNFEQGRAKKIGTEEGAVGLMKRCDRYIKRGEEHLVPIQNTEEGESSRENC